ncbi:VOC family protein [Symbiobacterium thermophilum]|uniref:VOC family protein n=1 Tax=Symbiobacterium thermophilum TaxID=2734 RepID=UPI0035C731A3
MLVGLHHVLIDAPPGCEEEARAFYGGLLGLPEIPKPAGLRERGGVWFRCGGQEVHVGVEEDFRPARKAHPAFLVQDLDGLRQRLVNRGIPVTDDVPLLGCRRFHARDPFGNRLEFLQPCPS